MNACIRALGSDQERAGWELREASFENQHRVASRSLLFVTRLVLSAFRCRLFPPPPSSFVATAGRVAQLADHLPAALLILFLVAGPPIAKSRLDFVGLLALNLSMGQWLSIPMILVGVAVVVYALRNPSASKGAPLTASES